MGGSGPARIFWFAVEAVLASSSSAARLLGGNVVGYSTETGSCVSDGFSEGESERGGVEAPENRRRWICSLLRTASRLPLFKASTTADESKRAVPSAKSHWPGIKIDQVILVAPKYVRDSILKASNEDGESR